jgi:hypothetical protein
MKRRKSERLSRAVAAAGSTSSSTPAAPASTRGSNSSAKRNQPQQKKDSIARNDVSKQQKQKPSAASSSTSEIAENYFNLLLDEDSRLKIFSCLTWQDLAVAAQVSRAFRDDCRHPSLTQNSDREMVLTVPGRCGDLYRLLAAMVDSNRLATYTKLKVVRRGRLE